MRKRWKVRGLMCHDCGVSVKFVVHQAGWGQGNVQSALRGACMMFFEGVQKVQWL